MALNMKESSEDLIEKEIKWIWRKENEFIDFLINFRLRLRVGIYSYDAQVIIDSTMI